MYFTDLTDPLIYAGPAWDYDLSCGNMADRGETTGTPYVTVYRRESNLYWTLYNHESFRKLTGLIWQRDFRPAVEVLLGQREAGADGIVCSLDEYRERISASADMNFRRWPVNKEATQLNAGVSFDHAVEYLKNWIARRAEWMNSEYTAEAGKDSD